MALLPQATPRAKAPIPPKDKEPRSCNEFRGFALARKEAPAEAAALAKKVLEWQRPLKGYSGGIKSMFPLTPPKQMTFLISVLLAIAAVVVRYLVYTGVQMPPFLPTGGFLLLLIAYLVLAAGNLFEGA